MIQRDFILRMLEEAAQAIAALTGLRQGGKYEAALEALGETYQTYFPFSGETLCQTEEADLLNFILYQHEVALPMLDPLADLLREEGEYWYARDERERAVPAFRRARLLIQHLDETEKDTYSLARMNKLSLIEKRLREIQERF